MLSTDDVNIPSVMKAFDVLEEEAEQYLLYGCGEYAIDHTSLSLPNCNLNTLKTLETVLCEKPPERYVKFNDLLEAYNEKVSLFADMLAKRHVYEYKIERGSTAFYFQAYCLANV